MAGSRAATVAAEGELAGDFGGEVPEKMGHGDEAAADDAGCDFGDSVCGVSLRDATSADFSSLRPQCDGKQIVGLVGSSGAGNACNEVHDA